MRADLNEATARQIEAEELMKLEDGDFGDGLMTEAEMAYLSSMEEVKTISKQLVVAEKAFALVRDRIRHLISKYESLLVKIDNEEMATSSVITADSSCFSDGYVSRVSTDYDQEERAWYRRQQRAEISAELAAREALLSKQGEARCAQEERHHELKALQLRLSELQSEPSTTTTDRQRSVVLAKAIAARQKSFSNRQGQQKDGNTAYQVKVEGVKQRFRDRMAARMKQNNSEAGAYDQQPPRNSSRVQGNTSGRPVKSVPANKIEKQKLIRLAGEEMFQHLDFYERSLQAVENQREGSM